MEEDEIDQIGDKEGNHLLLQVSNTVNPYLVKTPKVLDDWVKNPSTDNKGETHFSDVDNPGRWSSFSFWPTFERVIYKAHCILTVCVPLPRIIMGDMW